MPYKNKEDSRAQWKRYQAANRTKRVAYSRAYYADHHEQFVEYWRAYREANRPKRRASNATRKHRLNVVLDYQSVFDRDAGICGICKEAVDPQNWHLDHIKPLAKGGTHCYENVQVAHPVCNLRKGVKVAEEETSF